MSLKIAWTVEADSVLKNQEESKRKEGQGERAKEKRGREEAPILVEENPSCSPFPPGLIPLRGPSIY